MIIKAALVDNSTMQKTEPEMVKIVKSKAACPKLPMPMRRERPAQCGVHREATAPATL